MGRVSTRLERARRHESQSLLNTKRLSASRNGFESAIRSVDQAAAMADALWQSRRLPYALREQLRDLEGEMLELNVRLRLHIASLYSVRGSYRSAISWANSALAFNPNDQSALEARGRIEESAAAASARYGRFQR